MENTQEISIKDIMGLLVDEMPTAEAEVIMEMFTCDRLYRLFNSIEFRNSLIKQCQEGILGYELTINTMKRINYLVENLQK